MRCPRASSSITASSGDSTATPWNARGASATPLLFALADEDAYVYCDKDVCLECTFMCKRGFVFYVGVEDMQDGTHRTSDQNGAPLTSLIVRLPLTRMSPYWESRP